MCEIRTPLLPPTDTDHGVPYVTAAKRSYGTDRLGPASFGTNQNNPGRTLSFSLEAFKADSARNNKCRRCARQPGIDWPIRL